MKIFVVAQLLLFATIASLRPAEAAFEWAGAFTLNDPEHQWSMQKVGGAYVESTMRLVLYSVDMASQQAIETNEAGADALILGADCKVVEAGETIGPIVASGSCFELHVGSDDDSLFPMNTTGVAGMVAFAQHLPAEFERDMHYLKDSNGVDIEPVAQEGDDAHDHSNEGGDGDDKDKPACACVAKEHSFNIDCTATSAVLDSLSFLKANSCATDCSSDACKKSWYVVQAHHDYCAPDVLPSEIEDGFHDFDEICDSCEIERGFVEGAPACPEANCEDQSGNEAYVWLVDNGCATVCSSDPECVNRYLTLHVVHDTCDHDVLSTASEEGLHDFEDSCADVICNAPDADMDQLTCKSTDSTTDSTSQATTFFATGAGAGATGIALLLMA
jgi:hypothetical protein